MTIHDNGHVLLSSILGACAGLVSWLADPALWKAAAVALFCGFLTGIGRAVGQWAAERVRKRGGSKSSGA